MDVTGILTRADVPHALHSFGDYEVYKVDFAELGILSAAAHELINIPAGKVFVDGFAIVTGAAASSGAASLRRASGRRGAGSGTTTRLPATPGRFRQWFSELDACGNPV